MFSDATSIHASKRNHNTEHPALPPRERRALEALLQGSRMRESLDVAAQVSNGPDVIFRLRKRGLTIHCERVERIDADGLVCRPGRYTLDPASHDLAIELLGGAA